MEGRGGEGRGGRGNGEGGSEEEKETKADTKDRSELGQKPVVNLGRFFSRE